MSDRPILMADALVRGLLAGKKTQTRRTLRVQPPEDVTKIEATHFWPTVIDRHGEEGPGRKTFGAFADEWCLPSPFGGPGDRLYVREAWAPVPWTAYRHIADDDRPVRSSVDPDSAAIHRATWGRSGPGRWYPSIHMPRWASRLTLDVTGVRVERAQAISDADVAAEGIDAEAVRNLWHGATRERRLRAGCHATRWPGEDVRVADDQHQRYEVVTMASRRNLWRAAWILLHGEESWRANPWCWVIEFKRAGGAT